MQVGRTGTIKVSLRTHDPREAKVRQAEVRGRLNAIKNRLCEFARSVVDDERIRPNHAWRHRFVTLSPERDLSQELRRMILAQGGKGADEEVYGEPAGLYREICKLPHYTLETAAYAMLPCSGLRNRGLDVPITLD